MNPTSVEIKRYRNETPKPRDFYWCVYFYSKTITAKARHTTNQTDTRFVLVLFDRGRMKQHSRPHDTTLRRFPTTTKMNETSSIGLGKAHIEFSDGTPIGWGTIQRFAFVAFDPTVGRTILLCNKFPLDRRITIVCQIEQMVRYS